jgi:DNA-binding transcriptional ArsR family regulator
LRRLSAATSGGWSGVAGAGAYYAGRDAYLTPAVYSTRAFINQADDQFVTTDQLSTTFAALADPTRRAILARLAEGEATVNELAEPFPITLQAISKHLKVLERARLIARGRSAQLRPSRLQGDALKEVADWLADYRGFWEERFDRLDEMLRETQNGPQG